MHSFLNEQLVGNGAKRDQKLCQNALKNQCDFASKKRMLFGTNMVQNEAGSWVPKLLFEVLWPPLSALVPFWGLR